jgi:hypothetical protein
MPIITNRDHELNQKDNGCSLLIFKSLSSIEHDLKLKNDRNA